LSQYYFLVSSLPYLLPESEVELTFESFLNDSKTHLGEGEFNVLQACRLNPNPEKLGLHPVLDRWISWEASLRNEMVQLRASNLQIESEKWVRDISGPAGLFDIAREAVQQDNPLEAEKAINKARWQFLDELGVGHFFDFKALLVFALKLQILERQSLFTSERGNAEYRKVYDQVVQQIQGADV